MWNGYELSWLDRRGKPQVALAFRIPADSRCLIESKSFKLYLNSFASTALDDAAQLRICCRICRLRPKARSSGTGAGGGVFRPAHRGTGRRLHRRSAADDRTLRPARPDFLRADDRQRVEETLVSHLLKSNCPVTGQPDWASVQIAYAGPRIEREGLLRYLVSFASTAISTSSAWNASSVI